MSDSKWLQIVIRGEAADVDFIEQTLDTCGALAVSCHAEGDDLLFDNPQTAARVLWPVCEVVGLFKGDTDPKQIERAVNRRTGGRFEMASAPLEDEVWEQTWRERFKPMHFGNDLWICPSWCEPPDERAKLIRLDPGMAFGTGTHETTALCLEWIANNEHMDKASVLDFGCGSGVLAIAAARCGAGRVVAVDIDPQAREVARSNAEQNGCRSIEVMAPEAVPATRFDILVANILSGPLIALAPAFARHLRPLGALVLAGVLREQTEAVLAAYSVRFTMERPIYRGEWARLEGCRNSSTDC